MRRPGLRRHAALLAVLLSLPTFTGCLAAQVPDLFAPADPVVTTPRPRPPGPPSATWQLQGLRWDVHDRWAWVGSDHARFTDEVTNVTFVNATREGTTGQVPRYRVVSTEERGGGLGPVTSNHTYDETLGLVRSRTPGADIIYSAYYDSGEAPNVPLTFVGTTVYNLSLDFREWARNVSYVRTAVLTGLGREGVRVPAGDFLAWHVRIDIETRFPNGQIIARERIDRWFNETVRHDVKFARNGFSYELTAFRVGGDPRPLPEPTTALPAPAHYWLPHWRWHYVGDFGFTATRDILPCSTPFFPACADWRVVVGGEEHFALRTAVSVADSELTYTRIELVRAKDFVIPAMADYRADPPTVWSPTLNFTKGEGQRGGPPPLVPRNGHFEYTLVGRGPAGTMLNHTALSDMTIEPARPTLVPLRNLSAIPVALQVEHFPRGPEGERFEARYERNWSSEYRNDAVFSVQMGTFVFGFLLDAVRFGVLSRPDRDL